MATKLINVCGGDTVFIPGGGGGGDCDLIRKSISENGTYYAQDDNADGYSTVDVNVPNSYSASDEGKVVDDGALVEQGSQTITENGTYDTTLIAELVANISGGGGGAKNILGGTTDPTSAEGTDGDIYIKYTDMGELPAGYKYVEYIENTATGAYINTGYLFKADSRIEIDVNMSGNSLYPSPFGCRTTQTGRGTNQWYFSMSGNLSPTSVYYAMGNDEQSTGSSWKYNTRNHISAKAGEATITGGIDKTIYTNAQSGVGTIPLFLFAVNSSGSPWASTWGVMKLYGCQIYESDTLVMDFVPAKRDSDDAVGLYERVNDVFYTNSGTGTFTAGKEGLTPIDKAYLKVDGSWIILEDGEWDDVNTQGGGDCDVFAFIVVEYPAGEICTATNGTITLTAPDTSGHALFLIPTPSSTPETWTVSVGGNTYSAVINNSGDSVKIIAGLKEILAETTYARLSETTGDTAEIYSGRGVTRLSDEPLMFVLASNGSLASYAFISNSQTPPSISSSGGWGGFQNPFALTTQQGHTYYVYTANGWDSDNIEWTINGESGSFVYTAQPYVNNNGWVGTSEQLTDIDKYIEMYLDMVQA